MTGICSSMLESCFMSISASPSCRRCIYYSSFINILPMVHFRMGPLWSLPIKVSGWIYHAGRTHLHACLRRYGCGGEVGFGPPADRAAIRWMGPQWVKAERITPVRLSPNTPYFCPPPPGGDRQVVSRLSGQYTWRASWPGPSVKLHGARCPGTAALRELQSVISAALSGSGSGGTHHPLQPKDGEISTPSARTVIETTPAAARALLGGWYGRGKPCNLIVNSWLNGRLHQNSFCNTVEQWLETCKYTSRKR